MIKADRPAKVKAAVLFALALLYAEVASVHLFAQDQPVENKKESELWKQEEEEFGVGLGRRVKKKGTHSAETPPILDDYQKTLEPESIKPIEAEEFKVRLQRRSRSGRVLLFEDPTENRPRPGKVLLLKRDGEEISAIRVLKLYATEPSNKKGSRFAAKIILPLQDLQAGVEYRALKKLGDRLIEMIRAQERKDVDARKSDEELAKEVEPDDAELDRGIPTPPPKAETPLEAPVEPLPATEKKESTYESSTTPALANGTKPSPIFDKTGGELDGSEVLEVSDEDEAYDDLSPQDHRPYEPSKHALSVQYANIQGSNGGNDGATTARTAFGIRYAFNLMHPLLLKKRTVQDMLSLELGVFYYTISAFERADDLVTVVPIIPTVRYSLVPGETLQFFVYAGYGINRASQNEGAQKVNLAKLERSTLAFGAGLMIKLGPGWAARIDYGKDMLGLGAVLRF